MLALSVAVTKLFVAAIVSASKSLAFLFSAFWAAVKSGQPRFDLTVELRAHAPVIWTIAILF